MNYTEQRDKILTDPASSRWVCQALRDLDKRDVCDALNELEQLSELMTLKFEEVTK